MQNGGQTSEKLLDSNETRGLLGTITNPHIFEIQNGEFKMADKKLKN